MACWLLVYVILINCTALCCRCMSCDAGISQLAAVAPVMAFAATKEFDVSVVDSSSSGSNTAGSAAYVNMTLGSGSATMNASSSMKFAVSSNANAATAGSKTATATTLQLESDRAQVSSNVTNFHCIHLSATIH
jgi:hypothetical protein